MTFNQTWIRLFALLMVVIFAAPAVAQLPRDVRDVFEGMLDELDNDLKLKFEKAIKAKSATVTFTPEQFIRFRDNPVNPFEGLEQIDAKIGGGNIALKFELPSIRNRIVNPLERQSESVLSQLRSQTASAAACMVKVFSEDRHVAMGTVIAQDGKILTKASEINKRDDIACILQDGRRLSATTIRVDSANDLALLQVNAQDLPEIVWTDVQLIPGSFVLIPGFDGSAAAIGTYSAVPRSTVSGEQAFLGVKPETTSTGVRVTDINPGNASHEAGLRDGDVITKLGGKPITDVSSLVKSIRDQRRGDTVHIEYHRNGIAQKTTAKLDGKNVSGEQAARFKMMNRLGAIPSRRADNFPTVFQHDSPLFPEQCGGPITDIDGNVIGINIARQGRAASYAIPANHVQTILKDLNRTSVASSASSR